VEVSYRKTHQRGIVTTKTAKAVLVGLDEKRDLALLKIDAETPLPVVHLETAGKLETGEQISVIGNPGLGDRILEYSMTTGVISNPRRKIEDEVYVQTSAALNPGFSGGPMFNGKGNVVGLAVLKANIENTGFAVPADALTAFLRGCASGSQTAQTPPSSDGRSPDQVCAGWFSMAENLRRNGMNDKAKEYLNKIITTYPNSDWARKAKAVLKGL
jgi:S1-C subfamily serine protease